MIFDTVELAERKNLETGLPRADWLNAFENARETLKELEVDYQVLEYIAVASCTPALFTVVARLIYQNTKSNPSGGKITELILELVNRSMFSLTDWIDSINYFNAWLIKRNDKIEFVSMLRYLECCVAAPDAKKGGQTLLALLEDMLAVHGYDAG